MRKLHIDYLIAMAASVTIDGLTPFAQTVENGEPRGFLEHKPLWESLEQRIPVGVISRTDKKSVYVNRRAQTAPRAGVDLKYVRQLYEEKFTYQVEFFTNNPSPDVISQYGNEGILDQCERYIGLHNFLSTNQDMEVRVRHLDSRPITDPDNASGIVKHVLTIMFEDGLYEPEKSLSLSGAEFAPQHEGIC